MITTPDSSLRVQGAADLIAVVPYLLGFHPTESLVVIGLDDTKVIVTARINLPDMQLPGVLDTLFEAVKRGTATKVVLVVLTDTIRDADVSVLLAHHVELAHLELVDTLLVTRGRWRSLDCQDPVCCPAEGTTLSTHVSEFAAAATYAGISVQPNRQALADVLTPRPGRESLQAAISLHEQDAVQALRAGTIDSFTRSATRALFAAARTPEPLADEQVARFGAALSLVGIRDSLWMAIDDGRLDGHELWADLARRLPSPYDAPALFLYGWQAWRTGGDGARAAIAAKKAIESDPNYRAADLLLAALARQIDPRRLPTPRAPKAEMTANTE